MSTNTLYLATDTTGAWDFKKESDDPAQPHLLRLSLLEDDGKDLTPTVLVVRPRVDWQFEPGAIRFHGIGPHVAREIGTALDTVLLQYDACIDRARCVVMFGRTFQEKVLHRAHLEDGRLYEPRVMVMDAQAMMRRLIHANAPKTFEAMYYHCTAQQLRMPSDPRQAGVEKVKALREIYLEACRRS